MTKIDPEKVDFCCVHNPLNPTDYNFPGSDCARRQVLLYNFASFYLLRAVNRQRGTCEDTIELTCIADNAGLLWSLTWVPGTGPQVAPV